MRLTCALLLFLAAASPAAAKTYNGMAFAGPTISGDSVAWGTEYSDGTGAVKVDGRIVARFDRLTGAGEKRQFGGTPGALSASATRMAYTLDDSRQLPGGDGDSGASEVRVQPYVSVGGAPFANPLGPGCVAGYVSTAIEGDTVVIAINGNDACAGVYIDGRKVSEASDVRQVRIAGPYVAWEEWPGGAGTAITIADAATGAVLRRFPAPPNQRFDAFDLDERGNVFTSTGRDASRLVTFNLTAPRPRTLAKRIWGRVAAAGGRVAYITPTKTSGPDRLLLIDLQGKVLKRLDRFHDRRQPEGEIALTDRWVAWSVKRTSYEHPTGPGNVYFKKL